MMQGWRSAHRGSMIKSNFEQSTLEIQDVMHIIIDQCVADFNIDFASNHFLSNHSSNGWF